MLSFPPYTKQKEEEEKQQQRQQHPNHCQQH